MSALGTLAAGIAHEIRNPLVSIQTFFQLAPTRLNDHEFFTSFLGLAETEVKRIADLVTELLTFARSHPDVIQEVDIDDTIDRTVKLLSPQANKQRVRLQRVAPIRLPTINVDPDRIKQVLINVILNGIQATPENGTVTIGSRTVDHQGHTYCQIAIKDTGPGIPAANREDIFNPFFTTKDKGTGLGLSIAHQIVTDHGGFITVETGDGEGCEFFIHLPVGDANLIQGVGERRALAG
jgi:signal transduction histidine kinase